MAKNLNIALFCALATIAFLLVPGGLELFPKKVSTVQKSAKSGGQSRFKIKHIYHHNTGASNSHGRLDITEDLVESSRLHDKSFDSTLLEDFSGDDTSPWTRDLYVGLVQDYKIQRLAQRDPDFVEQYVTNKDSFGVWSFDLEVVPNTTDKSTVVSLALMSSNAYVEIPGTGDWTNVGGVWNNGSVHFGWMSDGLRGHVFVNEDESIVVISIKGTSAAYVSSIPGIGGGVSHVASDEFLASGSKDTVANDKINDNLLFSCCCARVSYLWTTVCNCYEKSHTCNLNCLEKELRRKDRYYEAVLDLYRNVTSMYPNSTIWTTGHSLGGSLASLLARTYGLPCVTFQAPGEALPAKRLHLPQPPGMPAEWDHVWHFGNTGDPIFMGVCNGASSTCSIGGYAMESVCHTGKMCVYDTVSDLGWSVSIYNHRIHTVVDDIILAYNETAKCLTPPKCVDCFNWDFV